MQLQSKRQSGGPATSYPVGDGQYKGSNLLGDLMRLAEESPDAFRHLEPVVPERGFVGAMKYTFIERPHLMRQMDAMEKSLEVSFMRAAKRAAEAEAQPSITNPAFDSFGFYGGPIGVADPTGITFAALRELVFKCEPLSAIVGTRIEQVASFSKVAEVHRAHVQKPGFRIRLANSREEATDDDNAKIAEYEQYFSECGYCDPPDSQKPDGWQPGFVNFLKTLVRDTLTLDWVAVRTWRSKVDPAEFPLVAFACEDAGNIRRRVRIWDHIDHGVEITQEAPKDRATKEEIVLVKVDGAGGRTIEEYKADELFTGVRRPTSDATMRGYGQSEALECVEDMTTWAYCRDYNKARFKKDSLPRGVLTIFGKLNEQQLTSFTKNWRELFAGAEKRWQFPILTGAAGQGNQINWTPFDMSNRDMEYGQFVFMLAVRFHAAYHISPEETGYSATSPFRPPLSEASPEVNLEYSKDTGLRPLLEWIADLLNRNILWRIAPSRRYIFEFVGEGDWNEMEDAETATARLNAGISTPRMEWAERDLKIPDSLKDHPAWDFPMPFAAGVQLIMQMEQQEQAQKMQEQQQQAQTQQQAVAAHSANQDPTQLALDQAGQTAAGGQGPGGAPPPPQGGPPGNDKPFNPRFQQGGVPGAISKTVRTKPPVTKIVFRMRRK